MELKKRDVGFLGSGVFGMNGSLGFDGSFTREFMFSLLPKIEKRALAGQTARERDLILKRQGHTVFDFGIFVRHC